MFIDFIHWGGESTPPPFFCFATANAIFVTTSIPTNSNCPKVFWCNFPVNSCMNDISVIYSRNDTWKEKLLLNLFCYFGRKTGDEIWTPGNHFELFSSAIVQRFEFPPLRVLPYLSISVELPVANLRNNADYINSLYAGIGLSIIWRHQQLPSTSNLNRLLLNIRFLLVSFLKHFRDSTLKYDVIQKKINS